MCVAISVLTTIDAVRHYVAEQKKAGRSIGFVPTMGYLHEGHASLMSVAREHADDVVVSVFVNPTQFAPHEDLSRYPRDIDRDVALAERMGAAVVFVPNASEMYPQGFTTSVRVGAVSAPFEGVTRPTHFEGVATVVAKLFHIVAADVAVFGQKDYQQCAVVQQLVRDLNIPTRIVIAPTVRESDGLAMSSRNVYLAPDERKAAPVLFKALQHGEALLRAGVRKREDIEMAMQSVITTVEQATIDYAAAADAVTLAQPSEFAEGQSVVLLLAVRLGTTRLIDNAVVQYATPMVQ